MTAWTCLLALAASVVAQADDNLLENPGFEQVPPDQALPVGWNQLPGGSVAIRTDGGRTGQHCVHFTDTAVDAGISLESQHLPVRAGGHYIASAWFRSTDNVRPGVYLQFHNARGERIAEVHTQADCTAGTWVQVVATGVASDDAEQVSVLLYSYVGDVGSFEADDACLTVQGPAFESQVKPGTKECVELGSRLELFVDDFMIDDMAGGARRVLHHPTPREIVLAFDAAWEGPDSTYVTVFPDGDLVRMYYRGVGRPGQPEVTCYAESKDGVCFTRPNLGLYETANTKENNVCWMGEGTHNFTPFKDTNPAAKLEHRYKALAGGPLWALASPDGIHWNKLADKPVITKGAFDSQNLAFFDEVRGQYVSFFRDFAQGVRTVKTCSSADFISWSEPQWCDYGAARPSHLYTNATIPYFRAPHIFLSFPKRFMQSRTWDRAHPDAGISDGLLMSSRDAVHWDRWEEAFLRPGLDPKNWTDRNMMIAWGLVPTSSQEISLYWTEHYSFETCRLRRGTIRTDGFVSLYAGMTGGEVLTRPLTFSGNRMLVNYSTSAAGSIRFELQDEAGRPLPGFEMADSETLFGDEIDREVTWKTRADLGALAGKPVRLRMLLRDADLYSFKFAPP